jgi:DNA-binding CsgD family transcriptional regulator
VAARLWKSRVEIDVSDAARRVTQPALVVHARKDRVIPYAEGRRLATLLPNAQFVTLDTDNHVLQEDEPAWEVFISQVRAFLADGGAGDEAAASADISELSERERDVLELVAAGMSNEQIAERLFLSPRTVERHLSNVYAKLRLSGKSARAAAAARFSRA